MAIRRLREHIRDILAECSRKPHPNDPQAGRAGVDLLRRIEGLAAKARDLLDAPVYTGPARDGIEAQHGLNDTYPGDACPPGGWTAKSEECPMADSRNHLLARPESEWHEDDGVALWWVFPIVEEPYCGSPLYTDWPGYHTHWTPIVVPDAPSDTPAKSDLPTGGR
jgi:hypothetical protein